MGHYYYLNSFSVGTVYILQILRSMKWRDQDYWNEGRIFLKGGGCFPANILKAYLSTEPWNK